MPSTTVNLNNVNKISVDDSFGLGSFLTILGGTINYSGGSIIANRRGATLVDTVIVATDGPLTLSNPLTVYTNGATVPNAPPSNAPGGSVDIGGTTLDAGLITVQANGVGSGAGGGITISAGQMLSAPGMLSAHGGGSGGGGNVLVVQEARSRLIPAV